MNSGSPHDRRSEIDRKLSSLRSKIRVYVVVHGLMLAIVWLCLSYWVALALDYGPVLLGLNEMPQGGRVVVLLVIALMLGWILYRWVFRRVFADLNDRRIALVLERRFPEFSDSLSTTVEATGRSSDDAENASNAEMLETTRRAAVDRLNRLSINDVFNFRPVYVVGSIVLVLALVSGWFVASQPEMFATSFQRLYLLDEDQWPRHTKIAVMGLKVKRENPIVELHESGKLIELVDGKAFVGQASDLELVVSAEAPSAENPQRQLPRTCEFRYWTDDGSRGNLPMNRIGSPRNGKQIFSLEGLVLSGIMRDVHFYVRGGDHRIGPYTIRVVPNPIITATNLQCRFPEYMVDTDSMRWTPRTVPWTSGTKLPYGTSLVVEADANRALDNVYVVDAENQLFRTINVGGDKAGDEATSFEFLVDELRDDFHYGFLLHDQDGVISQRLRQIRIEVIKDAPPNVNARLSGIGSAITPNALIPIVGQVTDDYGVNRTWVFVEPPVSEPFVVSCNVEADGELTGSIDLLKITRQLQSPLNLPTTPGSQLSLVVMASDHYDLDGNRGQEGVGDRYVLDIVSPDRLLRILERLEAAQRRILEQIYSEMTDARQYLVRSRIGHNDDRAGF